MSFGSTTPSTTPRLKLTCTTPKLKRTCTLMRVHTYTPEYTPPHVPSRRMLAPPGLGPIAATLSDPPPTCSPLFGSTPCGAAVGGCEDAHVDNCDKWGKVLTPVDLGPLEQCAAACARGACTTSLWHPPSRDRKKTRTGRAPVPHLSHQTIAQACNRVVTPTDSSGMQSRGHTKR